MLTIIDHKTMGRSETDWLDSWFHFSFADYYDPERMQYGVLRVVNDDTILPATGFPMHPHQDKEILTYVVDGELTHHDQLGHSTVLKRGEVQFMRAGTGILHSEENRSDDVLRLFQIWITPDQLGLTPAYQDFHFSWCSRVNQWMQIASDKTGDGPILLHQDIRVLATMLSGEHSLSYQPKEHRQLYLICMEGEAMVNGRALKKHDACKAVEEPLQILSKPIAHLLLFDMKESDDK